MVAFKADSLIGSTIPLVPSTEIPPSIPSFGLKVLKARRSPSGIQILTRRPPSQPARCATASTSSKIIFLGTGLIA